MNDLNYYKCVNTFLLKKGLNKTITSQMESTSFLPYQSFSYMSSRHSYRRLEDSCMAGGNHEKGISKGKKTTHSIYVHFKSVILSIDNLTFYCSQIGPKVFLQFGTFHLCEHMTLVRHSHRPKA